MKCMPFFLSLLFIFPLAAGHPRPEISTSVLERSSTSWNGDTSWYDDLDTYYGGTSTCTNSDSHRYRKCVNKDQNASIDKDIIITVNGKEFNGEEYKKEFVTSYVYMPKYKKFKVIKCNQDKLLEQKGNLVEKRHKKKRHLSRYNHPRDRDRKRREQWLECQECGKYLRGYGEAADHFDDTGHKRFNRVDL